MDATVPGRLQGQVDTYYGLKLVHSALKALTKPENPKSMPKKAQKRQKSRFFHVFRAQGLFSYHHPLRCCLCTIYIPVLMVQKIKVKSNPSLN